MYKAKQIRKIIFIIILCNISFATHLFSQNKYKRKICISEWIKEMESCKYPVYQIKNTEIYYDKTKDSLYTWNQTKPAIPSDKDIKSEKTIRPLIMVSNCKLPYNFTCQIRNLIFQNNILFISCEGALQVIFYNCTFKKGIDFHMSDFNGIEFWSCSILQRTVVSEFQSSVLLFKNCSFYTDYKVVRTDLIYGFEKENHNYQYLFYFSQNKGGIETFSMEDCKLLPTDLVPIIHFVGGKYGAIKFENVNFSNSIVNFVSCSVKENFTVNNCQFKQPFGMYHFNFPNDNTSFIWSQLDSAGLGLYTSYYKSPFSNKTDTLISDPTIFNELNSSYQKFFSMYRTRGDKESANACYKQMKDMETRKNHFLYQQNPNIRSWFNWRFNQFLKYFSAYGTNPVQSLIISMWTILIFAAVYFFFYSYWDGINRTFLIKQHRKLMQYFSSEQRLEDFYTDSYREYIKTFADYKKEMEMSKAELPFFIILLGKPLYLLSVIKHKTVAFMYRRTEILQGRWVDLNPARKAFVAFTVSLSLIIYLVFLVFIRALNSTTLSINAFSTLGFGAIPVKGLSRYITIIEGFLGWFLLSIFSVSLISQMLQN